MQIFLAVEILAKSSPPLDDWYRLAKNFICHYEAKSQVGLRENKALRHQRGVLV
jgi:hypothetical protein